MTTGWTIDRRVNQRAKGKGMNHEEVEGGGYGGKGLPIFNICYGRDQRCRRSEASPEIEANGDVSGLAIVPNFLN